MTFSINCKQIHKVISQSPMANCRHTTSSLFHSYISTACLQQLTTDHCQTVTAALSRSNNALVSSTAAADSSHYLVRSLAASKQSFQRVVNTRSMDRERECECVCARARVLQGNSQHSAAATPRWHAVLSSTEPASAVILAQFMASKINDSPVQQLGASSYVDAS